MNTFNIYVSLEGSGFIGVRQATAPEWLPESPEGFSQGLEEIREMVKLIGNDDSSKPFSEISDKASELFLMSTQRSHLANKLKEAGENHLNIVSEITLSGRFKTTPIPISNELAFIKSTVPYRYFSGLFDQPEATIH